MVQAILRRGRWLLEYLDTSERYEQRCSCSAVLRGPVIRLESDGMTIEHWHARRVFGRNRSMTELVMLALEHMKDVDAKLAQATAEAELAREEATALAEILADLPG